MTTYKAPPAELKKLANGVYAFLQPGGGWVSNTGLIIGKNYATVIDSLTNKYQIENFIKMANEVNDKPIKILLNTHYHMDHTFTNYYFKDALVYATQPTLRETKRIYPSILNGLSKIMPEIMMSFDGAKIKPQDIIFEGKLTVYDGIREIQFIDMGPAHAPSDVIVYLPQDKIIFAGDLLMVGGFGGLPSGANSTMDGSYRYIDAMNILANMDAEQFVPGHGNKIMTRAEVAKEAIALAEFLIIVREEARKLFNKGLTYQEATKQFDFGKLAKWGARNKLYSITYGNLARAWSEFQGNPLNITLDQEEHRAKVGPNPDVYPDRVDLGYTRPEPWD